MGRNDHGAYEFEYRVTLEFTAPARDHHLELRGAPVLSTLVRPTRFRAETLPCTPLRVRRDRGGNLIHSGEVAAPHVFWTVRFSGRGHWTGEAEPRGTEGWHSGPGTLTGGGTALEALWSRWEIHRVPSAQGVESLSNLLADALVYRAGLTSVQTTADHAAALGRGVCQDWAHVFLALWRRAGGEGRYVAGLAEGEGETHAWVEVVLGDRWMPWDPLRRVPALIGYLPLARGRDAGDCPLNRGVFRGGGDQSLSVNASLGAFVGAVE